MKQEQDPAKRSMLNTRQMALKMLANSMCVPKLVDLLVCWLVSSYHEHYQNVIFDVLAFGVWCLIDTAAWGL